MQYNTKNMKFKFLKIYSATVMHMHNIMCYFILNLTFWLASLTALLSLKCNAIGWEDTVEAMNALVCPLGLSTHLQIMTNLYCCDSCLLNKTKNLILVLSGLHYPEKAIKLTWLEVFFFWNESLWKTDIYKLSTVVANFFCSALCFAFLRQRDGKLSCVCIGIKIHFGFAFPLE